MTHGTRWGYMQGCRCEPCREAQTSHHRRWREEARKAPRYPCPGREGSGCPFGETLSPLYARRVKLCARCRQARVPAERARAHLLELKAKRIGRFTVSDVTGIGEWTLQLILRGEQSVSAEQEAAILSVDTGARLDAARVPAEPSRLLVREMMEDGYLSVYELHEAVFGRGKWSTFAPTRAGRECVRLRTAHRIEKAHARVMAERTSAEPALEILRDLLRDLSRREIATEIGMPWRALLRRAKGKWIRRPLLEKLRALAAETERDRKEARGSVCPDCLRPHMPSARLEFLRRRLPASVAALREMRPCWWDGPGNSAAEMRLFRDLKAVGAAPALRGSADEPWFIAEAPCTTSSAA